MSEHDPAHGFALRDAVSMGDPPADLRTLPGSPVEVASIDPKHRSDETRAGQASQKRVVGVAIAMIAIPALYLLFVAHYSMNALFEDDWNVVQLVHAALHGRLTLGALWAQHHQDRMFLPNLVFVGLGVLTHENTQWIILLSAVIFVAAFLVFLATFRAYVRRPITPLAVVLVGVVWFSAEDWHNALWAFQLPWYLSVFFLVVMIYLLTIPRRRNVILAGAVVAAVAASLCCFQGLALWPVGLICLVWTLPEVPHLWPRRRKVEIVTWCGAAIGTALIYFWRYSFGPAHCSVKGTFIYSCASESSTFALHHPITTAQFVFVELGEVIPNADAKTLWLNGLLGAAMFALAVFVTVQSIRHRRDGRNCLPVALLAFGLLFDLFIAVGRVGYGISALAPQSSYTMPNLLILVAIVSYAWVHCRREPNQVRGFTTRLLIFSGIAFLVIQFAVTTDSGIAHARVWNQNLVTGARLVVNLNDVPVKEEGCYGFYGVFVYLYAVPELRYPAFADAQEDHLSVFSPGLFNKYRAEGLPNIPPCRAG